jgi:cyclic pyranopterin phosphate synthase
MNLSHYLAKLPAASATPDQRVVDYMRISITDRCNERCLYCLPENFSAWTPRADILTADEILAIVQVAVGLGFKHFRVTGGEPLLRPDVVPLIERIIHLRGVETVQLTTNGTRLPMLARDLFDAGLRRVNISLDALDPERYRHITHGELAPVLEGIRLVKSLGFESIKLNTVLMRGKNEDQILPLVHFAAEHDVAVRFIELMPVSLTEMLDESNFLPVGEVKSMLETHDSLERIDMKLGLGPANYYRLPKLGATVGLIGALTNLHFCDHCNKVRLTADGKIRPCLGNHNEYDLQPVLRPAIQPELLRQGIELALREKPPEHLFRNNYQPKRIMTAIGG